VGEKPAAAGGAAGFLTVQAFDTYQFERMTVPAAAGSDFAFVNLFRPPVGAPMRLDAINDLVAAASRRAGIDPVLRPHQLRHAFGSNVADAGGSGEGTQPARRNGGAPVTAALRAAAAGVPGHGLAGPVPGGPAGWLTAGLAPGFLAEIGWDPSARVVAPPPGHPLLRDAAASRAAVSASGGNAAGCAVPGCGRQVPAPGRVLCRGHRRQQRIAGDLPLEQFLLLPRTVPMLATGPCQVPTCPRDRSRRTRYCEAHQYQLRTARQQTGAGFSEEPWRQLASPVPVRAQVSLRGLPELVAAEILYGLQQRTRAGSARGCRCCARQPRNCAGPALPRSSPPGSFPARWPARNEPSSTR
jgi:hypothetical protein